VSLLFYATPTLRHLKETLVDYMVEVEETALQVISWSTWF